MRKKRRAGVFLLAAGVFLIIGSLQIFMLLHHKLTLEQVAAESIVEIYSTDDEEMEGRKIDWALLEQINPDIAAWIYIPGTSIDYPVLRGEYIHKDLYGNPDMAGCIFMHEDADPDADHTLILFGHNLSDGQMFGSLKRYIDSSEGIETLYLYTRDADYTYSFAKIYLCEADDAIYRGSDSDDMSHQLILSTCRGPAGTTKRLTVHFGREE